MTKILQENEDFLGEVKNRQRVGNSSRFKTEHMVTDKGEFFVKTASQPELNEKIKLQINGARSYNQLLKDIDWLKAEDIATSGENWLATQWIAGGPIATPEQFMRHQNLEALETHAKVAAKLDEIACNNSSETSNNQIHLGRHALEPKKYSQSLAEKFEPFTARSDFDNGIIRDGITFFEERIKDLIPVWQHGDLTPWHIFKNGEKLVLIDCEHVRQWWPRYYDLANFYSQLHVRFDLGAEADEMVGRFNEIRGEDATKSQAFWAMAMVRTLRRALEHEDNQAMVLRAFKLNAVILNK